MTSKFLSSRKLLFEVHTVNVQTCFIKIWHWTFYAALTNSSEQVFEAHLLFPMLVDSNGSACQTIFVKHGLRILVAS